jgi:hypothetical protein
MIVFAIDGSMIYAAVRVLVYSVGAAMRDEWPLFIPAQQLGATFTVTLLRVKPFNKK